MATIHRGSGETLETADSDRPGASVNARLDPTAAAPVDRAHGAAITVTVIGATGYAGGEAVRLLAQHPNVKIVGLVGRGREHEPVGTVHPHLAGTALEIDQEPARAEAVFLALPHGAAAGMVPALLDQGSSIIDLGPDFRLHDPADYPRWYHLDHPAPELLKRSVYGLPELHRAELTALADQSVRIVGAPGCYPTATLLALAPLARAGLIEDLVVDAKSGVSGAGREAKQDMLFSEVNESVKAYGVNGHRHVAEMEQELAELSPMDWANPGVAAVDFIPHLIPMTRGILSTCHVRPTRQVSQSQLDDLYATAYAGEPFVRVVNAAPATKHVLGSNACHVYVRHDPRTNRILAIGVIDNLVKGAAGQAVQAFNLVHGLPETAGLDQLALNP